MNIFNIFKKKNTEQANAKDATFPPQDIETPAHNNQATTPSQQENIRGKETPKATAAQRLYASGNEVEKWHSKDAKTPATGVAPTPIASKKTFSSQKKSERVSDNATQSNPQENDKQKETLSSPPEGKIPAGTTHKQISDNEGSLVAATPGTTLHLHDTTHEEPHIPEKNIPTPTSDEEIPVNNNPDETTIEKSEVSVDSPSSLRGIRTFKQDVQDAMKNQRSSLVSIVLEEQKKKLREKEKHSPKAKKNITLIIFSIVFLILGSAAAFGAYSVIQNKNAPATLPKIDSLVFSEQRAEMSIDNHEKAEEFIPIFSSEIQKDLRLDTIKHLYFTETIAKQTADGIITEKQIVKLSDVLPLLDAKIPEALLRALDTNAYMFGAHSFNNNQAFIVLKVKYYENAFAGMLEWEPLLKNRVIKWFDIPTTQDLLKNQVFQDKIIRNKDTRVIYDSTGRLILLYAFKNRNTLIITTSEDTFEELLRRMDTVI